MQIIILAGGYGTRLYPLTESVSKPLIKIGGQCLIDYLFLSLNKIPNIDKIFIVTNNKFYQNFLEWQQSSSTGFEKNKIKIINDKTENEETKLGAIGDINFVIEEEKINSDLLVVAGDNFFSQPFNKFVDFSQQKNSPVLAIYDVKDLEKIKEYSEIRINEENQIIYFKEKPINPETTLAGIALYYYPRRTLSLIKKYVKDGNNKDQPGRFIEWLYKQTIVFSWPISGEWFDVGTPESLKEIKKFLSTS